MTSLLDSTVFNHELTQTVLYMNCKHLDVQCTKNSDGGKKKWPASTTGDTAYDSGQLKGVVSQQFCLLCLFLPLTCYETRRIASNQLNHILITNKTVSL